MMYSKSSLTISETDVKHGLSGNLDKYEIPKRQVQILVFIPLLL